MFLNYELDSAKNQVEIDQLEPGDCFFAGDSVFLVVNATEEGGVEINFRYVDLGRGVLVPEEDEKEMEDWSAIEATLNTTVTLIA